MSAKFHLPEASKPKEVEQALVAHYTDAESEVSRLSYGWTRAHWQLQGIRNLIIRNTFLGQQPEPHTLDSQGRRRIRIDRPVAMLQSELGRLMGIDVSPVCMRKPGVGLETVRGNALAQVSLDNFANRYDLESFKLSMMYLLAAFGTIGVGAFPANHPDAGVFGVDLSIIPPWELRPLPAGVLSPDQASGVCRVRWVPYQLVKDMYKGFMRPVKDENRLHLMEVPYGLKGESDWSPDDTSPTHLGSGNSRQAKPEYEFTGPDTTEFVQLKESWTYTPDHRCLRWSVMMGDHLAMDVDYTNDKSKASMGLGPTDDLPVANLFPIRYMTVGSFYGKGVVERILDLNEEVEALLAEQIQDLRETNYLRFLAVPISSGVNARKMREYRRHKILPYQPDMTQANARPEIIEPATVGPAMGQTIAAVMQTMDLVWSQSEMMRGGAPGRVDSAGGLAIIAEQQQLPLVPVSESVASGMSGLWKAVLGLIRDRVGTDEQLTLTRIDESAIGLRVRQDSGQVILEDGLAIPHPSTLDIGIRQKLPKSKQQTRQDLEDLLGKGIISRVDYRITAIKEGLDLPLIRQSEYHNYTAAWMENIILFGDGQTPGQITANQEADNHVLHFFVLQEFMSSYLFRLASPEVRNAFVNHRGWHLENMGQVPDPASLINPGAMGGTQGPTDLQAQMMGMSAPPQPGQTPLPEMMEAL